jgi:hypothetical protein
MITGVHAMFYTPDAEALRVFLRDKLDLPFTDTGGGWLIFRVSEVEIGCHPADRRFQAFSFYCDDLKQTMAALRRRGVEFTAAIAEEDWGWATRFKIPGGDEVQLYQPKYRLRPARRTQVSKPARRRPSARRGRSR